MLDLICVVNYCAWNFTGGLACHSIAHSFFIISLTLVKNHPSICHLPAQQNNMHRRLLVFDMFLHVTERLVEK